MGASNLQLRHLTPLVLVLAAVTGCGAPPADDSAADRPARIEAVPFTDVHLTDEFWAPRMEINRTVTIPHLARQNEATGRIRRRRERDRSTRRALFRLGQP